MIEKTTIYPAMPCIQTKTQPQEECLQDIAERSPAPIVLSASTNGLWCLCRCRQSFQLNRGHKGAIICPHCGHGDPDEVDRFTRTTKSLVLELLIRAGRPVREPEIFAKIHRDQKEIRHALNRLHHDWLADQDARDRTWVAAPLCRELGYLLGAVDSPLPAEEDEFKMTA